MSSLRHVFDSLKIYFKQTDQLILTSYKVAVIHPQKSRAEDTEFFSSFLSIDTMCVYIIAVTRSSWFGEDSKTKSGAKL